MDGPEYMLLEEVKAIKKEVEDEESFYNRLKKNATRAFLETSNHKKLKERLMKMTEDDKRSWQVSVVLRRGWNSWMQASNFLFILHQNRTIF